MIRPVRLIAVVCAFAAALAVPSTGAGATAGSRDAQSLAHGAQVAASDWTQMPNLTASNFPTANVADNAVSCVDADFCMGVGSPASLTLPPFAEVWNGATWAEISLPSVPGALPGTGSVQLAGVSCVTAQFCTAVGNVVIGTNSSNKVEEPLIETWNGSSWSVVQDGGSDSTGLEDVSCLSATFCMTVGGVGLGPSSVFVEQWNGTVWTPSTLADPAGATNATGIGISCTTSTFCMVVGTAGTIASGGAYVAQWDGTGWAPNIIANNFNDTILQSVSCVGVSVCVADGAAGQNGNHPIIDAWSDGAWSQATTPTLPAQGRLFGISCISATACTAVGSYAASGAGATLVFTWDGLAWTQPTNTPNEAGSPQTFFTDVSCVTNWACVAVGTFTTDNNTIFLPFDAFAPIARPGYRFVAADGGVFNYGAPFFGSLGGTHLNAPIVGMATMPAGDGYYLVAADGGVFTYGSAHFYGSMGGTRLNRPIVGIAVTADGAGYWLVASDGGIFAFGDAAFYGSMAGKPLNRPIVGIAATADGDGYYEVASDGGIFSFPATAGPPFEGSTGALRLNRPIVGMALGAAGQYYLVASDGGIFAFPSGAPFYGSTGSLKLARPVIGMTTASGGYYLGASDGGIFAFPTANGPPFLGSMGGQRLVQPIVGISG